MSKSRVLLTPALQSPDHIDLAARAYRKRVLPVGSITWKGVRESFTPGYLRQLVANFKAGALDTVPFLLDDGRNSHHVGPEQWRGTVQDLSYDEQGEDGPGLYARVLFPDDEAARAVQASGGKLGISARIQRNLERADGASFKRAVIHLLGTTHPAVVGLGDWRTVDLAGYAANDKIVDLTNAEYRERAVSKKAKATAVLDADQDDPFDGLDLSDPAVVEDILDQALAEGRLELGEGDDDEDVPDGEDDDGAPEAVEMSQEVQEAIDLANSRADAANERAMQALAAQAQARWDADVAGRWRGVPPAVLDLAQPYVNRADPIMLDLAQDGYADATDAIRQILDEFKGFVDLGDELGHSGELDLAQDTKSADDKLIDQWVDEHPLV